MSILNLVTDRYERQARVTPGLLVALPILTPLICVYGPRQPMLTALVGLLGGCGVLFALANIVRGRGKKLEERLLDRWGGMPTTIALRHRDSFFDRVTKQRYHAAITTKLGIGTPTAEEEAADPNLADHAYLGAARRLREITRGDKTLLLKENIAYGFHRNMLAMKATGLLTSVVGLLYGLAIANVLQLRPVGLAPANLGNPGLAGGLTLLVSLAMLVAWCLYFDEDKVRRIGYAYAERLFEHLSGPLGDTVKKQATRARKPKADAGGKGPDPL